MRRAYVSILLAVFASAGTAAAQNVLVNPNFDTNVASWNFTTPGTFTFDSTLDAASNPLSGSGRLNNTSPVAFGTSFAAQCVAVTGGSNYDLRAQIRIPSGQNNTGFGVAQVSFFDAASCGGSNVGGFSTPNVPSTTTDTWVLSQILNQAAPVTAVSAQVNLDTNKVEAGGSLVVNFDDAFLGLSAAPGPTPTPTPTATPTVTPVATPTATPTTTPTGTASSIPAVGGGGLVMLIVLLTAAALIVLGRRAVP